MTRSQNFPPRAGPPREIRPPRKIPVFRPRKSPLFGPPRGTPKNPPFWTPFWTPISTPRRGCLDAAHVPGQLRWSSLPPPHGWHGPDSRSKTTRGFIPCMRSSCDSSDRECDEVMIGVRTGEAGPQHKDHRGGEECSCAPSHRTRRSMRRVRRGTGTTVEVSTDRHSSHCNVCRAESSQPT